MMSPVSFFTATIFLIITIEIFAFGQAAQNKQITCYLGSWAHYREGSGKFGVKDLPPKLCTHVIYSFAGLDNTSWTIKPMDPYRDLNDTQGYRSITQLRKNNPLLKVSLAIGGWNEGSQNYSILSKSPDKRSRFIISVTQLLKKYGFTGFDLDWEFPAHRGGEPADKENFVYLVKELRDAFKGQYMLTAAISANVDTINKAYDITNLSKYLDYIHVMNYDYHGTWDKKVLPNAPLRSNDGVDVETTIKHLLALGAPANKLVMGLPFYGRTFILTTKPSKPYENPIGKPAENGFSGPYTKENGFMGYNEICEALADGSWTKGWDNVTSVPYAIKDDRVIVYDDNRSIKLKVQLANELKLGGVMIWSIETDDFLGICSRTKFTLIKTINTEIGSTGEGPSAANRFHFSYALLFLTFFMYYM